MEPYEDCTCRVLRASSRIREAKDTGPNELRCEDRGSLIEQQTRYAPV